MWIGQQAPLCQKAPAGTEARRRRDASSSGSCISGMKRQLKNMSSCYHAQGTQNDSCILVNQRKTVFHYSQVVVIKKINGS